MKETLHSKGCSLLLLTEQEGKQGRPKANSRYSPPFFLFTWKSSPLWLLFALYLIFICLFVLLMFCFCFYSLLNLFPFIICIRKTPHHIFLQNCNYVLHIYTVFFIEIFQEIIFHIRSTGKVCVYIIFIRFTLIF